MEQTGNKIMETICEVCGKPVRNRTSIIKYEAFKKKISFIKIGNKIKEIFKKDSAGNKKPIELLIKTGKKNFHPNERQIIRFCSKECRRKRHNKEN